MNKAHIDINWENYPSDETPLNERNLNKMDDAIDTIDDRVITLDTTKATKTEVATLVADVTFEESTGIITITKKNGSRVTIDTQMEKIAVNFTYNPTTQQIILTLIDGTKQYIDLSALITQYEFMDTDTVAFIIGTDGKVSALVKEGSIKEEHLEPNYLAKVKVEVAKAQTSASNAATSEDNARNAAEAAQASATAAATSESNAQASSASAAQSEANAKASENVAKSSCDTAVESAQTATEKAESASESANTASEKADIATRKATEIIGKAEAAAESATKAQSYAVGGTGSRDGEDSDNAKYYYQQAKDVSEGLKGGLQPHGTVAFSDLPALADVNSGWMFNISDEFATTDDFKEGAGNVIPAGANIYKTSDGKWDVLAGTPVTGIKGKNENTYRRGNVNLTAENVGAVPSGGNTAENTATFTSSDSADESASAWTSVPKLTSGEKHSSLFAKVSQMFKNIRYLYKTKQDASTAITTSNIGSQSVKYAEKAKFDGNGNEILYNYMRSSEFGGTIAELKAYTNGSPCFCGSGNFSDGPAGNQWYNVMYIPHRNGIGGDSTAYGQLIMFPMTGAVGTVYIYTKQNGNWTAPQAYHAGDYLPLSGGTLTGDLQTSGGAHFPISGNVYVNDPNNGCVGWLSNLLAARIPTTASCNRNWNYSGQGGQPAWLWGSNSGDGSDNYVWNPLNFTVNAAYHLISGDAGNVRVALSAEGANFRTYVKSTGAALDNAVNLGSGSYRWKQVFAGTSAISTSDRNLKKDIRELDENHLKFFLLLTAVSYQFIDGDSGRTHIGFIAQDVEDAMAQCGLTALDFAGFCKDTKTEVYWEEDENGKKIEKERPIVDADGNPEYIYSLRYEEFIALVTYATQKLYKKVDELETRMEQMEDRLATLEK